MSKENFHHNSVPLTREKLYIAGPMRGIKDFNFPAFSAAKDQLHNMGYKTICPASLDIEEGFETDKSEGELTYAERQKFIQRDIYLVVNEADGVCALPGFEKSTGAMAEISVARFLNKPVYRYPDMAVLNDEAVSVSSNDVLVEAIKLTTGDRQNQYGAPDQDFARTARMWSALKGVEFTTEDVAAFQICIKLSRNTHQSKRDNWVDMAGYARCGDICRQEKEKRNV